MTTQREMTIEVRDGQHRWIADRQRLATTAKQLGWEIARDPYWNEVRWTEPQWDGGGDDPYTALCVQARQVEIGVKPKRVLELRTDLGPRVWLEAPAYD